MINKIEYIKSSLCGYNHLKNQDNIKVYDDEYLFIVSVSDGLGSSLYSDLGALFCNKIIINFFKKKRQDFDLETLSKNIISEWINFIYKRTVNVKDYRTTNSFIVVFKKNRKLIIGNLGDVLVNLRIDHMFIPIEIEEKDFSNETKCLDIGIPFNYKIKVYSYIDSFDFMICTDGIGDEIDPDMKESFQDYLFLKYSKISKKKRNHILKHEIKNNINNKNNDDKSIVYAWLNIDRE